jgi:ABC-type cobalamin transport system ATPase subunit
MLGNPFSGTTWSAVREAGLVGVQITRLIAMKYKLLFYISDIAALDVARKHGKPCIHIAQAGGYQNPALRLQRFAEEHGSVS